jgi:phosphoserine phosphatase
MRGLTRHSPALIIVAAAATLLAPGGPPATAAHDPLPSWKDTPKKAIISFVDKVTHQGGPDYVAPPDRIAVFDNDGTLWAEKPAPFELLFAFDSVRAMASLHPEWRQEEPFATVLRGGREGMAALGEKSIMKIIAATHAGMTTEEFAKRVQTWIATARHPDTGLPYTSMVYEPMVELLVYLRDNGFKTFIVSGGGVEFMRPWVEKTYGIPPWQIVGSVGELKFEENKGSRPVLRKLPEIAFVDNNAGKPIAIENHIGRRPIAAFGNSDGDREMLEWATAGEGARLGLLVHHDDARREWAYDREDPLAKLDVAWNEAKRRGWTVVSMKNDWSVVFAASELGAVLNTPRRRTPAPASEL